jgi:hypothetical protein
VRSRRRVSALPIARPVTAADVADLEARLAAELPRFAVRYKDESRLQQVIARLVRPFNRTYLTQYTTVMFGRVYLPSRAWCERQGPETVYRILRHEAVHLRDARRWPGLFHVSYLVLLPAGLTMRAFWEWRAYAETLRVEAELTGDISDGLLSHVERCFTGPDYLFMCPFPGWVRARLRRLRTRLLAEMAGDS